MATAPDPPEVEPASIVIGDTWTWTRILPDYPADDWTLTYRLIPTTGTVITFAATDDGGDHLIDVPAATTAAYASGEYRMVGSVSDGSDRFEVFRALVTVLPNVTAAHDYRTYWETIRDSVQDALADASTRTEVSYSINGRGRTARSHDELTALLAYAETQIANEQSAGYNRKILMRFR